MKLSLLISTLILAACGTDEIQPTCNVTTLYPISRSLAGTWQGTATTTRGISPPVSSEGVAVVTLDRNTGTVEITGVCAAPLTVPVFGCDEFTSWHGAIDCPTPVDGCPTASTTYTNVVVSSKSRDELDIVLSGRSHECDGDDNISVKFKGHH